MDKELEKLLNNYQPSRQTIQKVKTVPKLFLVGVSGAGKNTLINRLLESGDYHLVVSHTTRSPRKNNGVMETDGKEYHFINYNKLKKMLADKNFVEAKKYALSVYGTSASEFDRAANTGKIALAEIEIQGVEEYMAMAPESTNAIFVLPPNFNTWQSRFKKRYQQNLNALEFNERLKAAKIEISHALSKAYYAFVVNDNLEDTIEQIKLIASGKKQPDGLHRRGQTIARKLLRELEHTGTR